MSEEKNKISNLKETQEQIKAKVLTQENKAEAKNILFISIFILIGIIYVYNNPFNFNSIIGIIKFIQLIIILFIVGCFYKLNFFMKKFKLQTDKIQEIYSKKTVTK